MYGLVVVSCGGSSNRPRVNSADLTAWHGVPLIELETHPVFAAQRRTVRDLSDGSQMWVFTRCFDSSEPAKCTTVVNHVGRTGFAQTRCGGGASSSSCCHNEFLVRNGVVERRDVVGPCYTTCDGRPASRPCSASAD